MKNSALCLAFSSITSIQAADQVLAIQAQNKLAHKLRSAAAPHPVLSSSDSLTDSSNSTYVIHSQKNYSTTIFSPGMGSTFNSTEPDRLHSNETLKESALSDHLNNTQVILSIPAINFLRNESFKPATQFQPSGWHWKDEMRSSVRSSFIKFSIALLGLVGSAVLIVSLVSIARRVAARLHVQADDDPRGSTAASSGDDNTIDAENGERSNLPTSPSNIPYQPSQIELPAWVEIPLAPTH